MKYCTQCGSEINENAVICIKCGCSVRGAIIPAGRADEEDTPSTGLAVLGFFIPLAGIIIFFVKKKTAPQKAMSCATGVFIGSLVSTVLSIIIYIIYFLAFGAEIFSFLEGLGSNSYYW